MNAGVRVVGGIKGRDVVRERGRGEAVWCCSGFYYYIYCYIIFWR